MEKDTIQQKLEIVENRFPIGEKVCNFKLGSVGVISGKPFSDEKKDKIFLPVSYPYGEVHDEVDTLFLIKTVPKGMKRKHN